MFESLLTNIKRKLSKSSLEPTEKEGIEKTGIKRKFQIFKSKIIKSHEQTVTINYNDNKALSPRAISGGDFVQTEIDWPIISDNNPNILDKFTKIVTIVDNEPYARNVQYLVFI